VSLGRVGDGALPTREGVWRAVRHADQLTVNRIRRAIDVEQPENRGLQPERRPGDAPSEVAEEAAVCD
jgi:hypothetical protein